MRGLMVVNAFLRTTKFDDIYHTLLSAAHECGMDLQVMTNSELSPIVGSSAFRHTDYDFVLFWDKDIKLAMQLEALGLRLFNSADSIFRCDDKSLTYLALKHIGIPMPETIIAPMTFPNIGYTDLSFVRKIADTLGFPIVLKECFGSFGQQVYLYHDLPSLQDKVKSLGGTPLLFQKLVEESYGRDARLNVVGDKVVASMLRKSSDGDFRSNLTRGGTMAPYTPTEQEADLAVKSAQTLGLDFAGVDMLFGKDGPIVCEINSNAHFKTTLECTGINIAAEIMRHIAQTLE
ncbi:MAG: RimK family alpha-L-glutamate ligase [Clostridiales bacterium]|nr:RimK family alpha-L-glutamate ligase [Clostridiales bacterium]